MNNHLEILAGTFLYQCSHISYSISLRFPENSRQLAHTGTSFFLLRLSCNAVRHEPVVLREITIQPFTPRTLEGSTTSISVSACKFVVNSSFGVIYLNFALFAINDLFLVSPPDRAALQVECASESRKLMTIYESYGEMLYSSSGTSIVNVCGVGE